MDRFMDRWDMLRGALLTHLHNLADHFIVYLGISPSLALDFFVSIFCPVFWITVDDFDARSDRGQQLMTNGRGVNRM